jgi:ribonuclease HII
MLRIGTDEAGYGPLLGPLVVVAAVFRDDGAGASFADAALRDSKEVYARGGRAALGRALAPYLAVPRPVTLSGLLARLSVAGDPRPGHPWYGDVSDPEVPEGPPPPSFASLLLDPICERQFNELCRGPGGKAGLLTARTLALVRRALDAHPGEPAAVLCDRHGGRKRYSAALMQALAPSTILLERETPERSQYRLVVGGREVRIAFAVRAERDPAVALASCAAKYVRELFMESLNAFFAARIGGLRPTAGYYEDGRRFVAEVASLLDTLEGGRQAFLRVR